MVYGVDVFFFFSWSGVFLYIDQGTVYGFWYYPFTTMQIAWIDRWSIVEGLGLFLLKKLGRNYSGDISGEFATSHSWAQTCHFTRRMENGEWIGQVLCYWMIEADDWHRDWASLVFDRTWSVTDIVRRRSWRSVWEIWAWVTEKWAVWIYPQC